MAYGKMRQRSKYIRVMGFNVDLAFIQRTTNRAVERRVRASNCGNWPIRLLRNSGISANYAFALIHAD